MFALTKATTELEAFPTAVFVFPFTKAVPAVMAAASDVEAVFVLALTAVVTPDVCVLVFALTANVPAEMVEARDEEAVVTSDWSASVPEERPAPVIVRVPNDQTWDGVRPFSLEAN